MGDRELVLTQENFDYLGDLFKVLGDPTRLKILSLLFQKELTVGSIVESLDMSQSAVSHQLSVLRQNRIVKSRRDGKNIYYSFDDNHIQMIYDAGVEHILEGR